MPSCLINGKTHPAHSTSPLRPSARTSVNAEERERLTASIISSNARRQPIDLDYLELPRANGHDPYPLEILDKDSTASTDIDVSARDPRDEAVAYTIVGREKVPLSQTPPNVDRPAGPYTLNPPIDFDGLSWPSESWHE